MTSSSVNREPEQLRRGKAFHKRVQKDWLRNAAGGKVNEEALIDLPIGLSKIGRIRRGRMDLYVSESGDDFVSIVEIKSTDWDHIKPQNVRKLLGSHRRQIWKYIEEFVDNRHTDVCAGMIYPTAPRTAGLKQTIEAYMEDYGLPVVWFDD